MPWSFDDLRKKYPASTDAEIHQTVAYLNTPAASVRDIWDGENQVGDAELGTGPDGLTRPQRELNRFADENALPMPFKVRPTKS